MPSCIGRSARKQFWGEGWRHPSVWYNIESWTHCSCLPNDLRYRSGPSSPRSHHQLTCQRWAGLQKLLPVLSPNFNFMGHHRSPSLQSELALSDIGDDIHSTNVDEGVTHQHQYQHADLPQWHKDKRSVMTYRNFRSQWWLLIWHLAKWSQFEDWQYTCVWTWIFPWQRKC